MKFGKNSTRPATTYSGTPSIQKNQYIVGVDSIERKYKWWEKLFIRLKIKQREYYGHTCFYLKFNKTFLEDGDTFQGEFNPVIEVINKPKLTLSSKIKKIFSDLFGFSTNLSYFYNVKLIKE